MNTIQISKVLTKHVKYSRGVYPIDILPSTLMKPSIIVINLDKYYMSGSHWVAICFSDSGYAEYFDSYGLPPYKLEIMSYLQHDYMTSFVDMFLPACYACNDIRVLRMFRAQFGECPACSQLDQQQQQSCMSQV